jgi:hypothetical protein
MTAATISSAALATSPARRFEPVFTPAATIEPLWVRVILVTLAF